jgi:hypothetical protein
MTIFDVFGVFLLFWRSARRTGGLRSQYLSFLVFGGISGMGNGGVGSGFAGGTDGYGERGQTGWMG